MANFWDLPRPIRDKIYRLYLVWDSPIGLDEHEEMLEPGFYTRRRMPNLLEVSRKAEREAAPIYYGENWFEFDDLWELSRFCNSNWPRHTKSLIRKLTVSWTGEELGRPLGTGPTYGSYGHTNEWFAKVAGMKGLKTLSIRVDEKEMIRHIPGGGREHRQNGAPLTSTAQQQLGIYRFPGMCGLMKITHVAEVKFLKMVRKVDGKVEEYGGALPNGALLTHILPKLRCSLKLQTRTSKKRSTFRLLDLPPELRTRIYEMILGVEGTIHPSAEPPTTAPKETRAAKDYENHNHESALAFLLANKQIYNEAVGIFYNRNAFIFYYPVQLQAFLQSISMVRQKQLRDITIHYHNLKLGGIELVEVAFGALKQLTGLRRLRIMMVSPLHEPNLRRGWYAERFRSINGQIRGCNPGLIPGMKLLFELRGIKDIQMQDLQLDRLIEAFETEKSRPDYDDLARRNLIKLRKAYDHFNNALAEAQQGKVNWQLCENNDWQMRDEFPILQERDDESEDRFDGNEDDASFVSDEEYGGADVDGGNSSEEDDAGADGGVKGQTGSNEIVSISQLRSGRMWRKSGRGASPEL